MSRIGIYAGTFDPVHAGHVAFALQSMHVAKLDELYFLPERRPRNKQGVEHFGHRVAMLNRAVLPHPQFSVLELTDVSFAAERTLPKLRQQFPDDQLIFLFGSDIIAGLPEWPKINHLLKTSELVIGLRADDNAEALLRQIAQWPTQPQALTMFASHAPDVSSGKVRHALRSGKRTKGALESVIRYSDRHWLYVSLTSEFRTP